MWTIERITDLCIKYCNKCNVDFNSPVVINSRLTRTLGRCYYQRVNAEWLPIRIEISRNLLKKATDESIEAVIAHECAHYVVCAITKEYHGHDATFRFYCKQLGTTNDKAVYHNIKYKNPKEMTFTSANFKYTLLCSECGKEVGNRSRACKVTRNPEMFITDCCNAKIKVIQNW